MTTLEKILQKYNLQLSKELPIEIPNTDRESLASLFAELGFKMGAEIGVEQGLYSETLCKSNPELKLYGVDPWKAYRGYREHVSQNKLDGFLEITKERMKSYNYEIVRSFSTQAATNFPDGYLDFVYIDGNHEFSQVVADICAWYPKVKQGGIVAGHDYIKRKYPRLGMHVPQAVLGFIDSYRISNLFLLGRKDRIEGERRDNNRSWFLVKE